MSAVKAVLFDLGGVLIDFVGLTEVRKLMRDDPGPEQIRSRWISSRSLVAFERGEIALERFASDFIAEWGLSLEPRPFLEICRSWVKGTLPGATELLEDLQPHFTLACLSNTNALHWDVMLEASDLGSRLERQFASHLIGRLKPDREVFLFVCGELGLAPDQILFFDDGEENVLGARQAGLIAYRVGGPSQARAKLQDLGLIR